jgi:hypothetical protein
MTQNVCIRNEKSGLRIGRYGPIFCGTKKNSYTRSIRGGTVDDFLKLLKDNAVLPLWPETGKVLGLCRGATYAAAAKGDIKTIRLGRLRRVPTAWLRAQLDLKD